ncbi:MAG: bifunctional glutamate N-acetyltransferase/amino-acid acetyltransferase ArgJ [Candidatus Omnitrophota bacterium]|nr:bifunctional glutamate N-acetyltransferase/amino-acid acetyltransferase ArgJ [Candidatus Omnitrophota bacterium]
MKIITGVTAPLGFKANGVYCGIKKSGKLDLALVYSDVLAVACGMFTTNKIQAAPIKVTEAHLKDNLAQAIIVNSGNANCSTGKQGLISALHTTHRLAQILGVDKEDVLVASTGIIGKKLPLKNIEKALPVLVNGLSKDGGRRAAFAIMTTDTKPKQEAIRFQISHKDVTIGAMAKGAGMVYPKMATMLAFITTDVKITPILLKQALRIAVDKSFNCISVDGCTSTNDMVLILANGLAKNKLISSKDRNFFLFTERLSQLCLNLAKKIVWDAEGATKFVKIVVCGAKTIEDAKKVGFAIANSTLVKTAFFSGGKNWGRIAAAIGQAGIDLKEDKLKINFTPFKRKEITITVNLNQGKSEATVYTSDLSYEYVRINARYN